MAAIILDSRHFLDRVGSDSELPKDRHFCASLLMWQWRADWRIAKEAGDYDLMDRLDKNYEMIQSL
jgi:hypothetical protein